MSAPTEFILLTGFLGSGKTSLLVDWLALPEAADTAVIINEAGEIDVDGAIIAESGTIPMAMLANGCVCCSLTNGLVYTIRALVEDREKAGLTPFRRIILESSGLSRPSPILRSLAPLAPLGLAIRVVTTCDAALADKQVEHFEEFATQLAAANTIVFTKLDVTDSALAESVAAAINPLAARVVEQSRSARALAAFSRLPISEFVPEADTRSIPHPRITVLRASFAQEASWESRLDWMEDLAAFCGDRLLRVKGFIRHPQTKETLLIQAVGTLFSPPASVTHHQSLPEALVVIVRDLTIKDLRDFDPGAPVHIRSHRDGEAMACAAM